MKNTLDFWPWNALCGICMRITGKYFPADPEILIRKISRMKKGDIERHRLSSYACDEDLFFIALVASGAAASLSATTLAAAATLLPAVT
jgi:hypothetical protein